MLAAAGELARIILKSDRAAPELKEEAHDILEHIATIRDYLTRGEAKRAVYAGMLLEHSVMRARLRLQGKKGGHTGGRYRNSAQATRTLELLNEINPERTGNRGIIDRDAKKIKARLKAEGFNTALNTIHDNIAPSYPPEVRRPGRPRNKEARNKIK